MASFGSIKTFVRQHFRIVLVSALALALACVVFTDGARKAQAAREAWRQASAEFQRQLSAASSLLPLKAELNRASKEWEQAKQLYEVSVDGGLAFGLLGRLCRENGIKNASVTLAGSDAGFHQGHLRARYYNFRIAGPFPAVFRVLQGLESSGVPAELKPLKVTASGAEVTAEGTLVLYSLNPPGRVEQLPGKSGKYDPFFDYQIRMAEIEQDRAVQEQMPQQQAAQDKAPQGQAQLGQAAQPSPSGPGQGAAPQT